MDKKTHQRTIYSASYPGVFVRMFVVFFFITSAIAAEEESAAWFPFVVDEDFSPSVIDMSDWLDSPAGIHGFVEVRDDKLVFEDGTPAKFWGVNICSALPYVENQKADRWAAYLAKYGVNSVRFHKFSAHGLTGNTSTELDPQKLDNMDYFHAALARKGIYYGWSHIYGHRPKSGERQRLVNYDEIANIDVPWSHLNSSTSGLVNFAPDLQKLHIELTVNMLNHVNPYTGKRYAEDPALIFVELQNEDNIFWSAIEKALQQAPAYRDLLCREFSQWLVEKYGSHDRLMEVWGAETLAEEEHLDRQNIYPSPNHGYFDWAYEQAKKERRSVDTHILDKLAFLYEKQIDFYRRFVDAIRATGYRGYIVTSCWQAGSALAHLYNLHADYLFGIIDRHNYFGGGTGHSFQPGKVNNRPMISLPGSGLLSTGMQAVRDRPFAISEWMSLIPNEWTAEAAPLIAAYGMGLQDWDASFSFASNEPAISATVQSSHHGVYNADAPTHMGLYPALTRMIYRCDVEEAEEISCRYVNLTELAAGRIGFDQIVRQDNDVKSIDSDTPSEALAIGKVVIDFREKPSGAEHGNFADYWDRESRTVMSSTGQLFWDYSDRGYVTINSERTKAVFGFTEGKRLELGCATIECRTPFAVIFVTSLDRGKSIVQTDRILVTALARAQNTDMVYNEEKSELLQTGQAPVLMEPVDLTLRIRRPGMCTVYPLDSAGRRSGRSVAVRGRDIVLDARRFKTIYYELEYR